MFKAFDPKAWVSSHHRNLPHWRQDGTTYFVTARLADSIPIPRIKRWKQDRLIWLADHGVEKPDDLTSELRNEFHRIFNRRWNDRLDKGVGECIFRAESIGKILEERFTEGSTYTLDAWVIMPNHFHALVTPGLEIGLGGILRSWKGGSARDINLALKRSGKLWQAESFDHIVRSETQLDRFREYIANNPMKAKLSSEEYSLGMGK